MFKSCFCQWVQDKRDLSIMFQIKGLKKKYVFGIGSKV